MISAKNLFKHLLVFCWLICWQNSGWTQSQLSLEDFLASIHQHSPLAKETAYRLEAANQTLKSQRTDLRPQLSFFGQLPDFTRSLVEAPQPNGTIDFQSVSTNNMVLGAELTQQVLLTGTTISLGTSYQRFDDFDRESTLFNGRLLSIGVSQPLFGFNALRWENRLAPLRYEIATLNQVLDMAALTRDAAQSYFDLLEAQASLTIARENLLTNDTLYQIGQERFALGKIAENELLQLQFEQVQSQKILSAARRQFDAAQQDVLAWLHLATTTDLKVMTPEALPAKAPELSLLLSHAQRYRPEQLDWERRQLSAERDLARTRRDFGPSVQVEAGFGLSNRGEQFSELYKEPQDQEYIRLSFAMPLIDWGKAKAERSRATATLNESLSRMQQERRDFESDITKAVLRYNELYDNHEFTVQARDIAVRRYQIAKQRFVLGNISITDLSLAASERNRAQQEFLQSTRTLWLSFFTLQQLTLYDFERQTVLHF